MQITALTERQRLFVEEFMGTSQGNGTAAAQRAGYSAPHVAASRLLRNAKVRDAMELRVQICPAAATREQLQNFWTQVMLDNRETMKDRLRASELLAKSRGEFKGGANDNEDFDETTTMSDEELRNQVTNILKNQLT